MNPMTKFRPGHSIARAIIIMVCVAALLSQIGCSSGSGDGDGSYDTLGRPTGSWCYTTHAYEYDQVDAETGLTLKANVENDNYSFIPFEEMVAEYKDLEMCVADNNTPAPTVVFTSFNEYPFQLELALYYYALQTVFIDTDQEDWLPQRNCISDREFLRHEFTHHVLYLNGEDPGHTNPKFEQCEAFGYKTCNGEYCKK